MRQDFTCFSSQQDGLYNSTYTGIHNALQVLCNLLRTSVGRAVGRASKLKGSANEFEIREHNITDVGRCDSDQEFFLAFLSEITDVPPLAAMCRCIRDGCNDRADIAASMGVSVDEVTTKQVGGQSS